MLQQGAKPRWYSRFLFTSNMQNNTSWHFSIWRKINFLFECLEWGLPRGAVLSHPSVYLCRLTSGRNLWEVFEQTSNRYSTITHCQIHLQKRSRELSVHNFLITTALWFSRYSSFIFSVVSSKVSIICSCCVCSQLSAMMFGRRNGTIYRTCCHGEANMDLLR